jgi:glycosyltransferase involved in cell wall biosynthesis
MTGPSLVESSEATPDLSIIMPCYNEEDVVLYTITRLTTAFDRAGYRLELVAVDNGSWDKTGEIIKEFSIGHPGVVLHRVEENQGYGFGALSGIPVCKAPIVGFIPADGQVDAEDLVRLYETAIATDGWSVVKVRRRFRMDGPVRKVVSIVFNSYFRALWPAIRSIDINGNPKILPRDALLRMNLRSKGWLFDSEMLVKSHYLGLHIIEHNVFARMRSRGLSHVRASACWEFFSTLFHARVTGIWKRDLAEAGRPVKEHPRVVV